MPDSRTFAPTIRDHILLAGGLKLAEIDGTHLIFEDRYLNRCQARGTPSVPVELSEIIEELLAYYAEDLTQG